MNKLLLSAQLAKAGDTQRALSEYLGISLSRLNAKINAKNGAEFKQNEIAMIGKKYNLTPSDINAIFFDC